MNTTLQISMTIGITIFFGIILQMLRKKKLNLKYTLVWLLTGVVLVVSALFPDVVKALSQLIGVEVTSNFVFMLVGLFTLLIILSLTVIVSKQHGQIFKLSQSIALLEKRIRDLERKSA